MSFGPQFSIKFGTGILKQKVIFELNIGTYCFNWIPTQSVSHLWCYHYS